MDVDIKPDNRSLSPTQTQHEEFEEIDTSENKPIIDLKEDVSLLDRGKGIKKQPRANSIPPLVSKTNMTRDQIKYCGAIMRNLKKHRDAAPFLYPVDYVKLNVLDYPKVIKYPMDLMTVDRKLNSGDYENVQEFISDIRLVFNNCFKFNGPEAMISMFCQNVESAFEKSLRQMPPSRGSTPPLRSDSPLFDNDEHEKLKRRKKNTKTNANSTTTTTSPSPLPSTRRVSEDGRPKREIHPPPSKDYPEPMTKRRNPRKNDLQMRFCSKILRELQTKHRDINYPFLAPVDVVALNIPDYVNIVKHPMDLQTIERKLKDGDYDDPDQFEADIHLMFNNCYLYNSPTLPIHKMGKELEKAFDEKWLKKPDTPAPTPVVDEGGEEFEEMVEEEEEEEEEEESEDDRDQKIAELERHIATISQQIASIKSQKRKKNSNASANNTSAAEKAAARRPAAKQTVKEKKPPKQAKPPVRRKVNNNSNRKKQPVQHKTIAEEFPEFSFDQKKDLSERINNLTGDHLNTVVNIIQSSMPNLDGQGQEEIVLDIDSLDRQTLHRLREFVTGESLMGAKKESSPPLKRQRTNYSGRSANHNDSSSESGESDSSSGSDSDDSGSSSD